jgi:hypothetical protein
MHLLVSLTVVAVRHEDNRVGPGVKAKGIPHSSSAFEERRETRDPGLSDLVRDPARLFPVTKITGSEASNLRSC